MNICRKYLPRGLVAILSLATLVVAMPTCAQTVPATLSPGQIVTAQWLNALRALGIGALQSSAVLNSDGQIILPSVGDVSGATTPWTGSSAGGQPPSIANGVFLAPAITGGTLVGSDLTRALITPTGGVPTTLGAFLAGLGPTGDLGAYLTVTAATQTYVQAASLGAAAYVATGASAARTLADRSADRLNAKDFGARGDGSTDDTAAIQRAINAAPTGGADIYLPPGTYRTTASLVLTGHTGVQLVGAGKQGTTLQGTGNYPLILDRASLSAVDGSTGVRQMWLRCAWGANQGTFTNAHGISLTYVNDGVIRDLIITGCYHDLDLYDQWQTVIDTVQTVGQGADVSYDGLFMGAPSDATAQQPANAVQATNLVFQGIQDHGVVGQFFAGSKFVNVEAEGGNGGWQMCGVAYSNPAIACQFGHFVNILSDTTSGTGISFLQGTNTNPITDLMLSNVWIGSSHNAALDIEGATRLTMTGVHVTRADYGVHLKNVSQASLTADINAYNQADNGSAALVLDDATGVTASITGATTTTVVGTNGVTSINGSANNKISVNGNDTLVSLNTQAFSIAGNQVFPSLFSNRAFYNLMVPAGIGWADNVMTVQNSSTNGLVVGNAAFRFVDSVQGFERGAMGYSRVNTGTVGGYFADVLYNEVGNINVGDPDDTDFAVIVSHVAGATHFPGTELFAIRVVSSTGDINFNTQGSGAVNVGAIGTPTAETIGLTTSLARLRERDNTDTFGITTNLSATNAQDSAALPSWEVTIGGANDEFHVGRLAPGGTATGKLPALLTVSKTGALAAAGTVQTAGYTVATLPAGVIGLRAYVTDATACTYMSGLVGGGSTVCPAFFNGSAWVAE